MLNSGADGSGRQGVADQDQKAADANDWAGGIATLIVGGAIVLGIIGVDQCSQALERPALNDRYRKGWDARIHNGIGRALVANKVRVCSEYYWRPSVDDPEWFLVACYHGGPEWYFFEVNTKRETTFQAELASHLAPRRR